MWWNPVEELLASKVWKLENKLSTKQDAESSEKKQAEVAVSRAAQMIDDMQEEYRLLTSAKE